MENTSKTNYEIKSMIDVIEKFKEIEKEYPLSVFYCITIWSDKISLQGKITNTALEYFRGKGYQFTLAENNHLVATMDCIQIILTT